MTTRICVTYRSPGDTSGISCREQGEHSYVVWSANTRMVTQVPQVNDDLRFRVLLEGFSSTREPRLGRFYSSTILHKSPLIQPGRFRVLHRDRKGVVADFNPAVAYLTPSSIIEAVADAPPAGDRQTNFWRWAGMETPLKNAASDFDESDALTRQDESSDSRFFSRERAKPDLDSVCERQLLELIDRLLPENPLVLDLMPGTHSTLPKRVSEATGVGMNREELQSNPQISKAVLQNLNQTADLMIDDNQFDAVISSCAIEYLIQPDIVIAEACRVLKPGGVFICSFSNRFHQSKAIKLWQLLHPAERLGWVIQRMKNAGFCKINSLMERGLLRDRSDPLSPRIELMDPLFAAWGTKPPLA